MSPVRRVEADGTRVYSNYTRYTPMPDELRINQRRKPADPRAMRWYGEWLLPLDLLEEGQRQMPETRPDTDAYDHMTKRRRCKCNVCRRPEAKKWKLLWRREQRQMRKAPPESTAS